jgi:diguanylate cyclase (GGDEF)-like protein
MLKEPRLVSEADLAVLRVNAITDPLTGLYNRRFIVDHLSREISRAERAEGILSVVLMDLKGFKAINDRLGHPVGDSVLVRTARVIRESLRAVDAGCRWGGDEFVLALPNTDMFSALAVAERVREKIAAMALPARGGLALDLHYGVASYPHDGRSTDFLLKIADLRLYQCRSQSTFTATAPRLHPRFAPEEMSVRVEEKGRGGAWIAPVVDLSYGGLAFRAKRREKWPARWKAEILQKHDPERHPIRLRPMHWAPLPGGAVRVGCAYA